MTLKTAGSQMVTATDTEHDGITGAQAVVVTAGAAHHLDVTGVGDPATANVASNVAVTSRDPYGNVATSYRGMIHFTSTDHKATLPANYTFTAADAGAHTFTNGVILRSLGSRSVTATDTVTSTITGSQIVTVGTSSALHFSATGIPSPLTAAGLDGGGQHP